MRSARRLLGSSSHRAACSRPATRPARARRSGSVSVGPVVWPDGRPNSTAPESRRDSRATHRRAVGVPPGSSHPRNSPNTRADGAREDAGQPQLRQHAIDAVRPLPDVLEEQHAARRRIERVRRAERRGQLRERAADEHAGCASPVANRLERRRARSRRAASVAARDTARTCRGRSRPRRAPAAARSSGRGTTTIPRCSVSHESSDVLSL